MQKLDFSASGLLDTLLRLRAVMVLIALLVIFSALSPAFLTPNNLTILLKHVAISAILAVGMTFVVLTGGIDLSVGSMAGLSGMIAGTLISQGLLLPGMSTPFFPGVALVIMIALLAGALVGAVNAFLIMQLGVAPFIATLGTLYVTRGAALLLSGGRTLPNLGGSAKLGNTGFPSFGGGHLLGVPTPVIMMLALAALFYLLAQRTPFGRHVYAIGGNERAATISGIRVGAVKTGSYVISGFCASIVGLIIASQLEASHPATGETFELTAIAAVVLGGTSLRGGKGSILDSLAGAFVIGVLADGMVLLGVSEFWQIVIKGVVIVFAVTVDQLQSRVQVRLRTQAQTASLSAA
jgi:erythritol transport system permease protein